jgi:hypothetical protein
MKKKFLTTLVAFLSVVALAKSQDNRILTFKEAKALADEGDAYGEAIVAFHYSVGWQTEKNPELAAKYAIASAQKGHPLGAFRLGAILRSGEAIPKNEAQGLDLQRRAFQDLNNMSGNPYAITALGVMLFQGKVVPENKKEAARLYKIAADMGFAPAQFNYAMCAQAGHGINKNLKMATEYIEIASKSDYPSASAFLKNSASNTLHITNSGIFPIIQRSPISLDENMDERVVCDINERQSMLATKVDNKIGLWEIPSGRIINVIALPSALQNSTFFLRGEDIILISHVGNEVRGAFRNVTISFFDWKHQVLGKSTLPIEILPYPETGVNSSLSKCGKFLLCIATIGSEVNPVDGYNDYIIGFWVFKLEDKKISKISSFTYKLDYDDVRVFFNEENQICLFKYKDGDGYAKIEQFYKFSLSGDLLNKATSDSPSFKKILSKELGVPINYLTSNMPFDVLESRDANVQDLVNSWRQFDVKSNILNPSFLRSLFQWGCSKDRTIVQLHEPAEILLFSNNQTRKIKIQGSNISKYKYVNASSDSLLTWGVRFLNATNKNLISVPYKINLNNLQVDKISLDSNSTIINAALTDSGKIHFCLGTVNNDTDHPKLAIRNGFYDNGNTVIQNKIDYELDAGQVADGRYEFVSGEVVLNGRRIVEKYRNYATHYGGKPIFNNKKNDVITAVEDIADSSIFKNISFTWSYDRLTGSLLKISSPQKNNVIRFSNPVLSVQIINDTPVVFTNKEVFVLDPDSHVICDSFSFPKDDWISEYDTPVQEITGLSLKRQEIYFVGQSGRIHILKLSGENKLTHVCQIENPGPASPILMTKDNFYLTLKNECKSIHFSDSSKTYPFEQFDLRLNRPDIVLERLGAPHEAIAIAKQLREKRLKKMGVTEEMLQPDFHVPEIEIVGGLTSSTAANELALNVKAVDSKYSLDRLRLYVNNVPVNGKEGELLRDAKSQSLERTIPIKLAAGRNKIQVSVLNSAGAESLYANAEVECTASRPKPTLYAVAMGVSEYSKPEWNLKYAAKDATDILARIRSKSSSSYGEVKELLLTNREVTKENLAKVREFLSKVTVDDTVLMFVAGHGLLDSKYDYYFGTSDIDFENPSGKGIAFEEFDDLLAELPCLKKSLLIDTCHAGELDEDEKKALAAAQSAPTGQQVAMHPVGARGMSVKPIEGARGKSEWYDRLQGLFVDLRRGSGSTILSSSAGAEYALESSEQKNGLFTYAVLEALDGKEGADANKDGSVTMSELAEYVKTRVATLTNNKQSPNVRRVNLEADFALAKK